MTEQANIAAQQAFGEAVNTGSLGRLDDLVAPDCIDHDPAPGQVAGAAGFRGYFDELRTAFPDLTIEVEHLVSNADNVAFAYTITGTHDGPFQGEEATGKAFEVRGVQVGRFVNGLLVERWGSSDELGLLTQLGLR